MTHKKNEAGNLLPMTVTEGVTVRVLPDERHEYLMTTREVANGYGVTEYAVRQHKLQHSEELQEGKHFVLAVSISNGTNGIPHNAILWTKRGVVRLGFFIKSERARLFRDWAEELVIRLDEQRDLFGGVTAPAKALPVKRRINRLTPGRVADILADVCLIKDDELRERIAMKIKGGVDYGC